MSVLFGIGINCFFLNGQVSAYNTCTIHIGILCVDHHCADSQPFCKLESSRCSGGWHHSAGVCLFVTFYLSYFNGNKFLALFYEYESVDSFPVFEVYSVAPCSGATGWRQNTHQYQIACYGFPELLLVEKETLKGVLKGTLKQHI